MHEADNPSPSSTNFNPLNVKLNTICHLPTLIGAHHILHVSSIRFKNQRTPAATHTYVFMVFRGTSLLFNFSYHVSDCRSQWPRGLRRGSAASRLLVFWVRIPPGAWMFVYCECCTLLARGLCCGLITGPGDPYRVFVCLSVIMNPL